MQGLQGLSASSSFINSGNLNLAELVPCQPIGSYVMMLVMMIMMLMSMMIDDEDDDYDYDYDNDKENSNTDMGYDHR